MTDFTFSIKEFIKNYSSNTQSNIQNVGNHYLYQTLRLYGLDPADVHLELSLQKIMQSLQSKSGQFQTLFKGLNSSQKEVVVQEIIKTLDSLPKVYVSASCFKHMIPFITKDQFQKNFAQLHQVFNIYNKTTLEVIDNFEIPDSQIFKLINSIASPPFEKKLLAKLQNKNLVFTTGKSDLREDAIAIQKGKKRINYKDRVTKRIRKIVTGRFPDVSTKNTGSIVTVKGNFKMGIWSFLTISWYDLRSKRNSQLPSWYNRDYLYLHMVRFPGNIKDLIDPHFMVTITNPRNKKLVEYIGFRKSSYEEFCQWFETNLDNLIF